MASCRKMGKDEIGKKTRAAIAMAGEDPASMSVKDKQEWLNQVMWEISLRLGQWGDTYHWTLEIQDEDEKERLFEGGCGF